jgi:hypothetical protein
MRWDLKRYRSTHELDLANVRSEIRIDNHGGIKRNDTDGRILKGVIDIETEHFIFRNSDR